MEYSHMHKDKVLFYLIKNHKPELYEEIDFKNMLQETELSKEMISIVLTYFQRIGFVSEVNLQYNSPVIYIIIHTELFDFGNRGGFRVHEEFFKKEIEKLLLEIESLRPSLGDKIEQFTTIVNNLASTARSFMPY